MIRHHRRMRLFGGLAVALACWPDVAAAQTPPVIEDKKIVSLHRARLDWQVQTSVCLEARDDDSRHITFEIVGGGAAHGTVTCAASCGIDPGAAPGPDQRSARCVYEPAVGFVGHDSFRYVATDEQGNRSAPATVEIDVRNEGLRWELRTAASTGLTSDTSSVQDIPAVLGTTGQDFLFVLNWQPASPRQARAARPDAPEARDSSAAATWPADRHGKLSRSVNVLFQTGMQTSAAAVQATDLVAAPPSADSTSPASAADASVGYATGMAAAMQRHFTAGGQFNLNATIDADGQGTYVELGVTGSANLDLFTGGVEATRTGSGAFLQLFRDGDAFFRGEAGLRVGLKQYRENGSALVMVGEQIVYPANLDDLVFVEFLYQRNNALGRLDAGSGDSRNRYVVRIVAQPQIANLPGRPKFLIGVEVTKAFGGGKPTTKLLYGLNLSGNRLF